ncbi:hypothetical protein SAMN05660766_3489 [Curtobacterium sp. 314Chir4.1]|uniref:glycosyltransferase n=1 Tax=Curtobacterium sp. 314Chir4.1 TaxID=1279028 RepID=UPI000BDAEEF8|nr:glycosyltransferase [Curtobacterium sp. 314Chir4.1]SOC89756.1 hypothetical protein SAMN05660766_3489 [Curtobacterium sp. 314Chir4.1]
MSIVRTLVRAVVDQTAWALRNRFSRRPITGDGDVTVSLTSFGRRARWVHLTIESVGAGSVRARRVVLWLDDAALLEHPPATLRRLARRGLEIRLTDDLGPHKKYQPAIRAGVDGPLVTCDDDVLYPAEWLEMLLLAHSERPHAVLAHRVNRITVSDGEICPYDRWARAADLVPTPRNFATGVKGVLYPEQMQRHLVDAGDGFCADAMFADDVWLHHVALRNRVSVLPVLGLAVDAVRPVRFARSGRALATQNVHGGGNDRAIRTVYAADELRALIADDWEQIEHAPQPVGEPA